MSKIQSCEYICFRQPFLSTSLRGIGLPSNKTKPKKKFTGIMLNLNVEFENSNKIFTFTIVDISIYVSDDLNFLLV